MKKISFKIFLNKKLPQEIEFIEEGNSNKSIKHISYPVYFIITFNRKTTQIKSTVVSTYAKLEDISSDDQKVLKFEENYFKKIIQYEYNLLGDKFSLSGIKKRFDTYTLHLMNLIEEATFEKYFKVIVKSRSEFSRVLTNVIPDNIPFETQLKATEILIPDFHSKLTSGETELFEAFADFKNIYRKYKYDYPETYPRIIDWLDGSLDEAIKHNNLEKHNDTINYLVDARIKYLNP
jgi:hypothetical protein